MTTPRSRIMAVLTVLAAMTVGIVLGVVIDRRLLHRRSEFRSGRSGRDGPFGMMTEPVDTASRNRMRARIIARITSELTLTPVQARTIDSVFARRELQLDALRARVGPQLDSLRDAMRGAIDSVLTAEQRVKFAEQRKKIDSRRRGERDGRGPPRN